MMRRQKGSCWVLTSMCFHPQFTQSALDCMGVEVGRLRAFLQVRAQPGLFALLCLPIPLLTCSPNADLVPHLLLSPA